MPALQTYGNNPSVVVGLAQYQLLTCWREINNFTQDFHKAARIITDFKENQDQLKFKSLMNFKCNGW